MLLKYILLVIVSSTSTSEAQKDTGNFKYGYDVDSGPNVWKNYFPTCQGRKQSPIALPDVQYNSFYTKVVRKPLQKDFNNPCNVFLKNKGTTFDFLCKDKTKQDSPVNNSDRRFRFASGHIHWGKESTHGSEHSVGGIVYPAEVHLIHYDEKFASLPEALEEQAAIVVQGFFLNVSNTDNPALDWLLNSLDKINGTDVETDIGNQPLFDADGRSIFQPPSNDYFLYNGSLTTPPCLEVIEFHIYPMPTPISERQLNVLRSLVNKDGEFMSGNFRNIQPLYNRPILFRTDEETSEGC